MTVRSEVEDLANTIALGYQVEQRDPSLGYSLPPREELEWIASWIVSEGWQRTSGRPLVERSVKDR
jgi:hypothetical protein